MRNVFYNTQCYGLTVAYMYETSILAVSTFKYKIGIQLSALPGEFRKTYTLLQHKHREMDKCFHKGKNPPSTYMQYISTYKMLLG